MSIYFLLTGVSKNKNRFMFFWKQTDIAMKQKKNTLIYAKMFHKYNNFKKLYIKHLKTIKFKKKFIKAKKQHDITGSFIKIIDNTGADLYKLYAS